MKKMQSIKDFKEKNSEVCLNRDQFRSISGGATRRTEAHNTNENGGQSSDQEVWTYNDSRRALYYSTNYFTPIRYYIYTW